MTGFMRLLNRTAGYADTGLQFNRQLQPFTRVGRI